MSASIRERFAQDHRRLARAFDELRNASEAADAPTLRAQWNAVESALRAHLDAEEQLLLPLLETRHPAEVLRVRAEHAEILRGLDELGVQVELHAIREETLRAFLDRLEAHAAREDREIYRISDEELDAARREAVIRHAVERARRWISEPASSA